MRAATVFSAILLAGVVLLAGGCDSFLERNPQTFTSADQFYTTPDEVEQGVVGAYAEVQILYDVDADPLGADLWAATEMRSDNTDFQYNASDRGEDQMEAFDRFAINDPTNGDVEVLWSAMYDAILQANAVLTRIEDVSFSDQERQNRLRGEAQFIRAFMYYHLVQLYGGVPLITEEVASPDGAFAENGRASAGAVWDQIETDLNNAVQNLPPAFSAGDEAGRATKAVARMLLARAHLAQGDAEPAVAPLQAVVNNSGHRLIDDYAAIFDPDNSTTAPWLVGRRRASSPTGSSRSTPGRT
jgi:hypothetical protein